MNKPTKTKATISKIIDLDEQTRHYILTPEEQINFVPGQFVNLTIENNGEKVKKPYSIVSNPSNKNIELCIKLVEEGELTPILWNMEIGSQVELMGGLGLFTLDKAKKEKIVLIGTGTGVAPLKSILNYELGNSSQKQFYLLFGARKEENLFYNKEFQFLEELHPNFKYSPVLSRPATDSESIGRVGYVQQNLDGIDYQNSHVFICGNPDMVESVKEELILRGLDEEHITTEKY